jgi:putative ABC transport system permease protein
MNRRRWFLHFLRRSLSQRKGRVAVASVSVMLAAAIVVSSLGLSLGIRQKLGEELKAYGANIIITPKEGYIPQSLLLDLKAMGAGDYSGQLYARVLVNRAEVEMIGLDIENVKSWKITGRWPSEGEVLAGTNIRDALGLKLNDPLTVGFGGTDTEMKVSGFVERGGPEDSTVMIDLARGQMLTGLQGKLSAVLLRAEAGRFEEVVAMLKEKIPDVDVKTLKQVAYAEESFLRKIELLMVLVTLVVVIASSISVSSTMSATVLERMKEIGLMKAIGGTKNSIRLFFLSEGCVVGLFGGLSGYALGFVSAQAVSKGAFQSFIDMPFYLFIVSLVTGLSIAVFSSMLPLADALRYKPSSILRGE